MLPSHDCCSERSDLAGTVGDRLKEGASINKSLVTLGSVISALGRFGSLRCIARNCYALTKCIGVLAAVPKNKLKNSDFRLRGKKIYG